MKKIAVVVSIALLAACQPKEKEKALATVGSIEKSDPALDQLISAGAKPEVLAGGFEWSEGPVWVASKKMLLFSDVPKNIVYQWTERDSLQTYLTPSGYTGSVPRGGEPGSNGLIVNEAGQLVLCQHGDRRLAFMKTDLDHPKPEFETLASAYEGKRFSSPNDVVQDSQGNYYFTDPPYGLREAADSVKETKHNGVYKLTTDGKLFLLVDSLTRPNGIGLSPDQTKLYVANSDPDRARWYEFKLSENAVTSGKIFFDATAAGKDQKGLPDGLKVDNQGNIFASGPGGIWIFNPEGKNLGKIALPEAAANCAFSDDYKTLFITMDMSLLRVKLRD